MAETAGYNGKSAGFVIQKWIEYFNWSGSRGPVEIKLPKQSLAQLQRINRNFSR